MKVVVKRFADNGKATMGAVYIDGIFQCFSIEDEQREEKVMSETRVPEGTYLLSLRHSGTFNAKYEKRYSDIHKGILCVHNAPDWKIVTPNMSFQYILIHTGNTEHHTAGCLLLNDSVNSKNFTGGSSVDAYKDFYPIVANHLDKGGNCTIEYIDVEEGK